MLETIVDMNEVPGILRTAGSTIFTVNFTKRSNKELRTMNCRMGVKKGVKGVGLNYDPKDHRLLPVYDVQAKDYRMIALDSVNWVKLRGHTYCVRGR
jgi:hypothetical protein